MLRVLNNSLSKSVLALASTIGFFAGPMVVAHAATIMVGRAVAAIGNDPDIVGTVGTVAFSPLLGGQAIKYFIPLGNDNGTYGVGSACGGAG